MFEKPDNEILRRPVLVRGGLRGVASGATIPGPDGGWGSSKENLKTRQPIVEIFVALICHSPGVRRNAGAASVPIIMSWSLRCGQKSFQSDPDLDLRDCRRKRWTLEIKVS